MVIGLLILIIVILVFGVDVTIFLIAKAVKWLFILACTVAVVAGIAMLFNA
ncbi:MAG: hypothetical protein P8J14_06025 [Emcibacteraceae bacterium]|nr:hypothetical protein [Emcibacteraceae bacterium]